ncbi:MAG: hypothetical protein LBV00_10325 [Propionibacteriaceae bacterium]|nr:hypothetical protein [Propionibacteriaceae bacterium]
MLDHQPEGGWQVTVVPALDDATIATVSSAKQAEERLHGTEEEAARLNHSPIGASFCLLRLMWPHRLLLRLSTTGKTTDSSTARPEPPG